MNRYDNQPSAADVRGLACHFERLLRLLLPELPLGTRKQHETLFSSQNNRDLRRVAWLDVTGQRRSFAYQGGHDWTWVSECPAGRVVHSPLSGSSACLLGTGDPLRRASPIPLIAWRDVATGKGPR